MLDPIDGRLRERVNEKGGGARSECYNILRSENTDIDRFRGIMRLRHRSKYK